MMNYSRIDSAKSSASGACNVREPRLMSQVRRQSGVQAYQCVFLHSEQWRCQYSSACVVAAVT
jgi:hypothetical protein